ncbi:MAG TPA: cation-translocating P-type ATPase [Candidatus Nanopelagicaceae bacterium]|nr:cation-translocating P-type ATPase [Candidatus Nanopelagicaceae bacterium]
MNQTQARSDNSYFQPIDVLISKFQTDTNNGLKNSEIENKFIEYGYNELPKIKKSLWKIYLAPIFNFLIIILIISAAIVFILGDQTSTIITFTVVVINSATVITQQFRAQKALESLRQIAALKSIVLRDGIQFEIPTKELVPGDIILLEQGNKIGADARIIDFTNLTIDEAPLTGESEPVEKSNKNIKEMNLPIQKQNNMVFMGTYINTGRGTALVTGTGLNTEIGNISNQLNEMGSIEDIPLTKKLNRLGYILGTIVIINLIILIFYKFSVLGLQGLFFGDNINYAITSSILRSMGIMPINLPLLSTLVLVTGVLNMAQSGVIVKNLSAIESLGRVSVICSDKTGTISKNEMTVERFWINNREYAVTGSGYDSEGEILVNGDIQNLCNNSTFITFIDSSVLNNTAKLVYEDVKVKLKTLKEITVRKALGSPTEAALLVLAEKAGYIPYDIKIKYKVVQEFSFSSEFKRMTTVCEHKADDSYKIAFSKGAPEIILKIANKIEENGKENTLTNAIREQLLNEIQTRAIQGYRILAIAYKKFEEKSELKRQEVENNLIFLGYVSILDPPRPGVRESVEECESGGIKVVMITGDHPATAKTIASQMRIYKEGDSIVEGAEVSKLNTEEFNNVSVFARVNPSDKEIIVEKYQSQGHICAMTGDGINDALALKLANAGIAMGITGTDVAKETADMVLSDDNFSSIVIGVKIGRGLFARIRNIIFFFICLNLMESVIFFAYEFVPLFDLFSSEWQHIYIYGIVHSLPAMALVIDKHPSDVMKEPPRDGQQLLNKNMWILLVIQAFLMGIGLVLALQFTLEGLIPLNEWNLNPTISYIPVGSTQPDLLAQKARTMFITTLYIVETTFIWTFRRPNKSLFKSLKDEFSLTLLVISLFTLALHVLFVLFSNDVNYYVNDEFGLDLQINFLFLSGTDWIICILLTLPGLLGIEIFKYIARRKNVLF